MTHLVKSGELSLGLVPYKQDLESRKGKKVGELNDNELGLLVTVLMESTSINRENYPDDMGINLVADYLIRKYKNWYSEEIKRAFYWSFEEGIKHYGQFSVEYIAEVLKTYNNKVRVPLQKEIAKPRPQPKQELEEWSIEDLIEKVKKQEGERHFYGKSKEMFKYLENKGKINLSTDEKEKMKAHYTEKWAWKKKMDNPFMLIEALKKQVKNLVLLDCYQKCLNDYFDKIRGEQPND